MTLEAGNLLACHDAAAEPGLWFIVYADEEGALAIDLTHEHPDIGYKGFEAVLRFEDPKNETEKIVLLGGLERPDDALIILHEAIGSTGESNPINTDFAFLSYNYVLLPGKPPSIQTPDNRPTEIKLKTASAFLISMGYRVFSTPGLADEIAAGNWLCLPATPEIVFKTGRRDRRAKLLNRMN